MMDPTLNATTFEAVPTTSSVRSLTSLILLIIGNHSGNPLDAQHS